MRFLRLLILSTVILVSLADLKAQVEANAFGLFNEALLFSQTQYGGTARIQGIGGAQIALGGDVSSILSNPAGLGFFNKSELSLSPGVNIYNSNTNYFDTETSDNMTTFVFNNLSLVYNLTKSDIRPGKWRGGSIGLSVNRINDFNRQFTYSGENFDNSIIDFFIEDADGLAPSQLVGLTGVAYDHFLINPFNDDPYEYDSFVLGFPIQDETVTTKGSQYQVSLSFGGNYSDKLYFGAGLGLNTLNYEIENTFVETDYFDPEFPDDPEILSELRIREELNTDGIGFTGTFGLIYRLNDLVRLGASVVTPTWYQLDEESTFDFSTDYNNYFYDPEDTVLGNIVTLGDILVSEYDLKTPLRVNGGVAFFIGKKGFVSADIEFVDYSSANLESNDFSTDADNTTIKNLYRSTTNFRLGGELRLQPILLRAGYSLQGDPYDLEDLDRSRSALSAGAGWRNKTLSIDLAVVHGWWDSLHIPYSVTGSATPVVDIENRNTNISLTAGFRF